MPAIPFTKDHHEAISALVSDDELSEAVADSGAHAGLFAADSSHYQHDGAVIGLRIALDPAYAGAFDALGLEQVKDAIAGLDTGEAIGKVVLKRRERLEDPSPVVTVAGLAGLGDLDDDIEPLGAAVAVAAGQALNAPALRALLDEDDDMDEEPQVIVARPVPVTATISTDSEDDATTVAESLIPTLAQLIGAYEVGAMAAGEDVILVELHPLCDSEEWLCALPNGTVFFTNPVPVGDQTVTVELKVAGEIDEENPPLDIDGATAQLVAAFAAEMGAALPAPESLVLELTRTDGAAFSEDQLRGPLQMAVANLTLKLGPITITGTMVGEEPSVRLANLSLDGEGELDARAIAMQMAGFEGTLPFPGIGMVHARLVGVA